LFGNFKIIDKSTSSREINEFLKVFELGKFNFDFDNFINYFSPKKIVDDLS